VEGNIPMGLEAQVPAVDPDIGFLLDAVEDEIDGFAGIVRGEFEVVPVPAGPAAKVAHAVSGRRVPVVGIRARG